MSLATSSPAWNLPSGQHLVITQPAGQPHPRITIPRAVFWLGLAATLIGALSLLAYVFAAFALNAHRGVLSLLTWLMSTSAGIAALALIAAVTVRYVCGHIDRRYEELYHRLVRKVTGRSVDEEQRDRAVLSALAKTADLPDELRGRVDRQGQVYAAMVGQVLSGQAELGERVMEAVEEFRQRLESVERAAEERDVAFDVLRGVTGWAMVIDQRLTDVQSTLRKDDGGCEVSAKSNGHKESSPMELSDEAMRGYFLGFYDRQANASDSDGN